MVSPNLLCRYPVIVLVGIASVRWEWSPEPLPRCGLAWHTLGG